jgi:hypothetical protein
MVVDQITLWSQTAAAKRWTRERKGRDGWSVTSAPCMSDAP